MGKREMIASVIELGEQPVGGKTYGNGDAELRLDPPRQTVEHDRRRGMVQAALEVPGNIDDEDSLIAFDEQHELEQVGALVVEEILPPVLDDQFGHEDGDLAVLVGLLLLENEIQYRSDDEAIGRLEVDEPGNGQAAATQGLSDFVLPFVADACFVMAAVNVNGDDVG